MPDLHGFPYFEVAFDKRGQVVNDGQVAALVAALPPDEVTDLFVMSHGWNNDIADARTLYDRFFDNMRQVLNARGCRPWTPGVGRCWASSGRRRSLPTPP